MLRIFLLFADAFQNKKLLTLRYILTRVIPERNSSTVHYIGFLAVAVVAVFVTTESLVLLR